MFDVTNFLMRWLFLSNLIHNAADIQTWDYNPYHSTLPSSSSSSSSTTPNRYHDPNHHSSDPNLSQYPQQPQQQPQHHYQQPVSHPQSQPQQIYNNDGSRSDYDGYSSTPGHNQQLQHQQQQQHQYQHPESRTTATAGYASEDEWREQCLHDIISYPPGSQRLLIMDAKRAELVQLLSRSLQSADECLALHEEDRRYKRRRHRTLEDEEDNRQPSLSTSQDDDDSRQYDEDRDIDADPDIMDRFGLTDRSMQPTTSGSYDHEAFNEEVERSSATSNDDEAKFRGVVDDDDDDDDDEPVVIITKPTPTESTEAAPTANRTRSSSPSSTTSHEPKFPQRRQSPPPPPAPSEEEVDDALRTVRVVRDYLPQLVSIVLKSPTANYPNLIDPVDKLRRLIIQRCVDDANWGVDLCWLLEAEVGRAWKRLFEHRQQTGRRIIVYLNAERAEVLKQIGHEKREAFDLLQDAEQATAFGYSPLLLDQSLLHSSQQYHQQNQQQQLPKRLPSSLSLRRCSHFGDTMQFIDQMTELSLDLRHVPTIRRDDFLREGLKQMNRKIRRRMVTNGDVSMDVDDHLGSDDWPRISDISADMIQYSVHLPLDPKQQKHWPGGIPMSDPTDGGVVRVLNIVEDECRLLASRERCPFLIRLEVAETGLRGNDCRLYASGARGLGTTVGEALAMGTGSKSYGDEWTSHAQSRPDTYHIPSELLSSSIDDSHPSLDSHPYDHMNSAKDDIPRGGWQADDAMFYANNPDEVFPGSPYDSVREEQYLHLHQQFQDQNDMSVQPSQPNSHQDRYITTGEDLLNRVFGQRWSEKCEEIRQTSPYGNIVGWRLASFIMKAGEDIRREALVMQIISKLNQWFQEEIPEEDRPHMRPYTIMSVGGDAGLVECLSDAKSIDEVKKQTDNFETLRDYFERAYGPPTMHGPQQGGLTFEQAQDNFLRSLVGYSLVCYILQIKDRHNANILLDRDGSVIHIDFGFVLGDTPKMGKVPIFSERAPFKLSQEFWDVLGGWSMKQGGLGIRFCKMLEQAFHCAATHVEEIASLVEATMLTLTKSQRQANMLANGVRNRLKMRGAHGSKEQRAFILALVSAAQTSWSTNTYDWLQRNMNGYQ